MLSTLLKDSAYKLTQFSSAQIQALENSIIIKQVREKASPYVVCLKRAKEIKLTIGCVYKFNNVDYKSLFVR